MTGKNPKVDAFLEKAPKWQAEMKKLRAVVRGTGLEEEFKWYQPCYTYRGANLVLISAFRDHATLSFFKGALLKDARGILEKPGANSQSARVVRFTSVGEVNRLAPVLKAYIREAIVAEQKGLKVKFKTITEHEVPAEFQKKLQERPALEKAFRALTPGRQRAYLLYFSAPRLSKTRESRIGKHIDRILGGKGLHDR